MSPFSVLLAALLAAGAVAATTAPVPSAPERPPPAAGHPARPARPAPVPTARWQWPLAPGTEVLRPFAGPSTPYGRGHRGLDLSALAGATVLAVEAGTITHAGVVAGRGTVTVRHDDGLLSTYEPVLASARPGQRVSAGDQLGLAEDVTGGGGGHCGARVCLHLGARRGGLYLDPLPLLVGGGRVRLLPLGGGA